MIVPTYERRELLSEATASLLHQSIRDIEVIVIDDGSPSGASIPPDPRVSLVRAPTNLGAAGARNLGIDVATSDAILFCDDDDVYEPHRVRVALAGLERAPIALCWSAPLGGWTAGRWLFGRCEDEILSTTTPHLGATAVRRDAVQPFDPSYRGAEDVEWWIRMASTPVDTFPTIGYRHRQHFGARNLNGLDARIEGSRRMLEQHFAFFARHPQARAFRLRRIAEMSATTGRWASASADLIRSIKDDADGLAVAASAVRMVRPSRQPREKARK